jgi:hypothetical protein
MDIQWKNNIKSSTPYINNYKNVKYSAGQAYVSYNLKVNEMEQNPFMFYENNIPEDKDIIHKNIMYSNKQNKQNIYFKHYNTKKPFKTPFPSKIDNKFIEKSKLEEYNNELITTFDVLNEKLEYKPKKLTLKEDIQATLKHKLENPTYQDHSYTVDRYYFI